MRGAVRSPGSGAAGLAPSTVLAACRRHVHALQKRGAATCVHVAARLTLSVRVCRAFSMLRSLPRTLGRQVLPARRPCAPGRADCKCCVRGTPDQLFPDALALARFAGGARCRQEGGV